MIIKYKFSAEELENKLHVKDIDLKDLLMTRTKARFEAVDEIEYNEEERSFTAKGTVYAKAINCDTTISFDATVHVMIHGGDIRLNGKMEVVDEIDDYESLSFRNTRTAGFYFNQEWSEFQVTPCNMSDYKQQLEHFIIETRK